MNLLAVVVFNRIKMAESSLLEDPNARLDELQSQEKKINEEKEVLLEQLKSCTTNEGKSKIIDLMSTSNEVICSIKKERLEIIHIMKTQLQKGRSSLYFNFSHLIFFSCKGAFGSPGKKIRRSLPPPTTGSKWTFDILRAYAINFKKVYSINELLFQSAPVTSGMCSLLICSLNM